MPWERAGPANQRRYWRVPPAWAEALADEHALKALIRLLSSGAFCRLLADCTDLALASYQRLEVQRWRPGDFTVGRGRFVELRPPGTHLSTGCTLIIRTGRSHLWNTELFLCTMNNMGVDKVILDDADFEFGRRGNDWHRAVRMPTLNLKLMTFSAFLFLCDWEPQHCDTWLC